MIAVFFTTFEFSSLDVLIANIVKQLLIIVHSNSPPVVWEWSHIYYMAGGAAGQGRTGGTGMEKQKKVLNVIKGYMSKFDIEQVTIIEDDKDSVIFSGDVEKFLHPCETMQNEAYRIKMTETKRVLNFNDEKLFIFI